VRRITLVLFVLLLAAGCGSTRSGGPTAPTTTAPPPASTSLPPTRLTIFRVAGGDLRAESVSVPHTTSVAGASLRALGLDASVTIAGGTASVTLPHATPAQVAEIVYTLTQYPTVRRVNVGGRTGLTRADVESFAPAILIESPAAGAAVPGTFRVSGSASVFEATFVLELVVGGKVETRQTVTASTGAPERGGFDATVRSHAIGPASLVAFAPSAEDGAPQHRVEVPVTIRP